MALERGVSAPLRAAVAEPGFHPVVLVYVDWPGAPVRAHTGVGELSWNGQTWAGVGDFAGIQLPQEAAGAAADAATLTLVGLPDELDDYLDDNPRNVAAEIWFGATTERAGNVLVGEPFSAFGGYVDAMGGTLEVGGGELRRGVRLSLGSGAPQRATGAVYHTDEDQSGAYPGDTAGRWVINAEARAETQTWPE